MCVCVSVSCTLCRPGIVRECVFYQHVCTCCNSHSKSKSLTAALMPAASQVMKGPPLVATDTSITATSPPAPPDDESITPSTRRSASLTLLCIIKVYSPDLPAQLLPATAQRRRSGIGNGRISPTRGSVGGGDGGERVRTKLPIGQSCEEN